MTVFPAAMVPRPSARRTAPLLPSTSVGRASRLQLADHGSTPYTRKYAGVVIQRRASVAIHAARCVSVTKHWLGRRLFPRLHHRHYRITSHHVTGKSRGVTTTAAPSDTSPRLHPSHRFHLAPHAASRSPHITPQAAPTARPRPAPSLRSSSRASQPESLLSRRRRRRF